MSEQQAAGSKQLHGVFIAIEVDDQVATDAEVTAKLAEVCPVDIFAVKSGALEIVEENLDECVLCQLCIEAAPAGTVRIKKLYDGSELGR